MGECGLRSGYAELVNVDPKVVAALIKMVSACLCANSLGQVHFLGKILKKQQYVHT